MGINEKELERLIGMYEEFRKKETEFKNQKDEIKIELDAFLHKHGVNEASVFVNVLDDIYEAKYVDRTTKSTDLVLLAETISDDLYNQIVQEKKSTYLKVGKKPAVKAKVSKVIDKENGKTVKGKVPKGQILR